VEELCRALARARPDAGGAARKMMGEDAAATDVRARAGRAPREGGEGGRAISGRAGGAGRPSEEKKREGRERWAGWVRPKPR
jgi:hypothetical protein